MSDYEFRCPDCKKVICSHSTGNVPECEDKVECINCGRVSIVQNQVTLLEVEITSIKEIPSQLDKLKQEGEDLK